MLYTALGMYWLQIMANAVLHRGDTLCACDCHEKCFESLLSRVIPCQEIHDTCTLTCTALHTTKGTCELSAISRVQQGALCMLTRRPEVMRQHLCCVWQSCDTIVGQLLIIVHNSSCHVDLQQSDTQHVDMMCNNSKMQM